LELLSAQRRRQSAAGWQGSRLGVHDEVALALDEHRHRDRLQSSAVLERLELIELEDAANPAASSSSLQSLRVKRSTVLAEQLQSMRDRAQRATERARALAHGRLRDEVAEQREVQVRLAQAVVEPEGLDREAAPALQAQEALHDPAVAAAAEVTLAAPTEVMRGIGRAERTR